MANILKGYTAPVLPSTMTEKDLRLDLKYPSGCYFFYGDEQYLIQHYTNQIYSAIRKESMFPESAVIRFDDDRFSLADVSEAVNSPPMMGGRKVVCCRLSAANFDVKKKKTKQSGTYNIEDICLAAEDNPDTVLIFSFRKDAFDPGKNTAPAAMLKNLPDSVKIVGFPYCDEKALIPWIIRHYKSYGVECDRDTAVKLIARAGSSMFRLASEIHKSAVNSLVRSRPLNSSQLEDSVTLTIEEEAFMLTNAILKRDTVKALNALKLSKADNVPAASIASSISVTLADMVNISVLRDAGYSDKDIASVLGIHPYRVSMILKDIRGITYRKLADTMKICIDMEQKMKSSGAAGGYVPLERFVCSMK